MLGLLAALAAAAVAGCTAVTPVEKVTTLLAKLKADVENEGKAEASTYEEFACFCKDKTATTSSSILANQDSVDSLSASIEEYTATQHTKESELQAKKQEQEQLNANLHETSVMLEKTRAEYDASDADLVKAISSLAGAISTLEKSKTAPQSPPGLLALRSTVQRSLALADAWKLIDQGPRWRAAMSLLQETVSVDPNDPAYRFHSGDIVGILSQLEQAFVTKKSETDGEWAKSKGTLHQTLADLTNQLSLAAGAIASLSTGIDALKTEIATARGSLIQVDATLKDDQLYIEDLTKLCETRATEFDQRSQMRAGELEALGKALSLLSGTVASTDVVNERALLLQRRSASVAGATRKALAVKGASRSGGLSFLQLRSGRGQVQQHEQQLVEHALVLLREAGGRLGSVVLSSLAARASADPFGKVKTLIQKLIERLLDEATAEATKKGFCDTEIAKASQDRDFNHEKARRTSADLLQLEAARDGLEAAAGDLRVALEALAAGLEEATRARAEEQAQNAAELATAHEGLEALKQAIAVLKTFYSQAAKAGTALLQASPMDEDSPGAGFEGQYQGKQESSKGIIGMLEVIQSDFERTIEKTTEAEKKAAAEFVQFDRASRESTAAKSTALELDQQDLTTTSSTIDVKTKDLKTYTDLVDLALVQLEDLKPMCVDNGMSFEERVQKRDEEVAALKRALCVLDPDGVEAECK